MTMLYLRVFLFTYLLCIGTSWIKTPSHFLAQMKSRSGNVRINSMKPTDSGVVSSTGPKLVEPNMEDMKKVAQVLANITDYLYEQPGLAMKVVSDNMGWLYSRNVPV